MRLFGATVLLLLAAGGAGGARGYVRGDRVDTEGDQREVSGHTGRVRRETHTLIGTFDISKMFKKKKPPAAPRLAPTPAPLHGPASLRPETSPPVDMLANLTTLTTQIHPSSFTRATTVPSSSTSIPRRKERKKVNSKQKPSTRKKSRKSAAMMMKGERGGGAGGAPAWPVKHAVVVEGDIILGGLMMVHPRSAGSVCGRVVSVGGLQALETLLFALQRAQDVAPRGVRLGAHVLDDCDNDTYGLEMALDFIKGSIGNIDDAEYACNATAMPKVISGVIGAASSITSVQVANLLRLFKIPQVSFFSTSPELSNKARFEYFTRTIPSDLHQVRAMVEIVKNLGWSYVSIIYEESNYGIKAFEELETELARHDICIAVKERLVKDAGVVDQAVYDAIVMRLLARPRARGVIVWGSEQEVFGVLGAVSRLNASRALGWVGSDGWAGRDPAPGHEPALEGTVSVQLQANPVRGFREYFLNLTVENNRRNPWFVEFWEDHFQCRYPGAPATPHNAGLARTCDPALTLDPSTVHFEGQLQFVADAVFAFAHAIRDMHQDLCGGKPGLCEAMRPTSGPTLLRYLRKVRFTGMSGDEFQFDNNGDGPARYNILHFKQVESGVYRWERIGEYASGTLRLDVDELRARAVPSVCSEPCGPGQARTYVEGERCCWHCYNCSLYAVSDASDSCRECPRGSLPDAGRARCRALRPLSVRPGSVPALVAQAGAAGGAAGAVAAAGVWLRHHSTPVVRASGRELSLVLLGGIFCCYLLTFALVLPPTDLVCSVQRFGIGFCFTVVYAALLTKTNRIARIFAASKRSARRPSLISPKSQLVICGILVSIQVVLLCVWQLVSPARAVRHVAARDRLLLVCDVQLGTAVGLAFFYPALLIVVCTVYAVLTRKIPEAFNESKHIGFTMYTTCVIWLAFVPLYFGTASHVPLRVISMAVTISLSASVTLVCLFGPKLYIILLRPERNVRASLMPAKWRSGAAAGGAVSAGLLGGAVGGAGGAGTLDPTPSTDRSTLPDADRCDRHVQTDDSPQFARLPPPSAAPLALDVSSLSRTAGVGPPLPAFSPPRAAPGTARRRRGVRITTIGQEVPL